MEKVLSLKWSNHKNSLLHLLSLLRKKSTYADVTLACDGKLYNVHKIVLSACSDYFSEMFDNLVSSFTNPIIVLKDISSTHLECLLDYMYIGEVNVKQSDLASLIQVADCLKLKGLAIPDVINTEIDKNKKRSSDSSPISKKKLRKSTKNEIPEKANIERPLDEFATKSQFSAIEITLKDEENFDDAITVKEESFDNEEYAGEWKLFNPVADNDSIAFDPNADSSRLPVSTIPKDTLDDIDDSTNETFVTSNNQLSAPSSSYCIEKKTIKSVGSVKLCPFCHKLFHHLGDLKKHIRCHTGEKPFPCHRCQYKASLKSHLIRHKKLVHHEVI